MKPSRYQVFRFLTGHLAALFLVALASQIFRFLIPYLPVQIIVLLYLLPVILSTVIGGLAPGILAGFTAFLAFNFYHLAPYGTFRVHATQDIITLVIFLFVAVVISQLIGQAREGVRLAQRREWEATHMYQLISALAGLHTGGEIAQVFAQHTMETFACDSLVVSTTPDPGEPPLTVTLPAGLAADRAPQQRPVTVPLRTARGVEGEARIWSPRAPLPKEEARLLDAYAGQTALALERVRLARSENKARVLEESDRLKSSLLNSVSHELRSPLAAIKASVSSLRTGAVDWDDAARHDLLATIEEETDHLNLLVGNLLDMSRIESGALEPHKRWNAIGEIAMGVAAKVRKHAEGHTIQIDIPDDLPLVPTDYVMIEQVFNNLLSNSIKYAPPGTMIGITSRAEGGWLHTQVTNQGPRVPPEHLERIFDKFHRVTEADRITGTGLGLSICKGIVEAHGGRIYAENRPDCFAFHFLLPLTLNGALPEIPRGEEDG